MPCNPRRKPRLAACFWPRLPKIAFWSMPLIQQVTNAGIDTLTCSERIRFIKSNQRDPRAHTESFFEMIVEYICLSPYPQLFFFFLFNFNFNFLFLFLVLVFVIGCSVQDSILSSIYISELSSIKSHCVQIDFFFRVHLPCSFLGPCGL